MHKLVTWLHHIFNPHCDACAMEQLELNHCKSCSILQQQLERANYEKDLLLRNLLHKPEVPVQMNTDDLVPVRPSKHVPWVVKRRELEENDRATAKVQREFDENQKSAVRTTIEALEKEIISEQEKTNVN